MNCTKNLIECLKETSANVVFEKMNGETTNRHFTLNEDIVGVMPEENIMTPEEVNEKDLIRAWSITDNGWRSFKPSKVKEWSRHS